MGNVDASGVVKVGDALPQPPIRELPPGAASGGADAVIGEDVDEDALIEASLDGLLSIECGVALHDLGEHGGVARGFPGHHELVGVGQGDAGPFDESIVLGAQHADVDIVVPRNEAVVAHSAEGGSPVEEVRDALLAAERIDGAQYLELGFLERFQNIGTVLHRTSWAGCRTAPALLCGRD